jgi:hypothetical protein
VQLECANEIRRSALNHVRAPTNKAAKALMAATVAAAGSTAENTSSPRLSPESPAAQVVAAPATAALVGLASDRHNDLDGPDLQANAAPLL